MPYRTHAYDKHDLRLKLADILEGVPEEEQSELLEETQKLLLSREFGHKGLVRNCDPKDPYWFERDLIKVADRLIAEGDPNMAYMECMLETNHGHGGWGGQTQRVYCRPNNEVEQGVSEELRQMIVKIATALLDSDPLSKEPDPQENAWLSVTATNDCLERLGADVPQDLVDRLKEIVAGYDKLETKIDEFPRLKLGVQKRFG